MFFFNQAKGDSLLQKLNTMQKKTNKYKKQIFLLFILQKNA